jgi:putative transposase
MESFWATLKPECADVVFASHSQSRVELLSYIMGFYNRHRSHSTLGYVSPGFLIPNPRDSPSIH